MVVVRMVAVLAMLVVMVVVMAMLMVVVLVLTLDYDTPAEVVAYTRMNAVIT